MSVNHVESIDEFYKLRWYRELVVLAISRDDFFVGDGFAVP